MGLVAVNPIYLGYTRGLGSATDSSFVLDANDEKAAWVGYAPKTGTIDRLSFRTGVVTLGDTVDVRLETVGTDGNPSGSLWAANTNGSQAILLTDDNVRFETTLTASASVTRGDKIALVVAFPAIAVGNLIIVRLTSSITTHPYTALYTGSWARSGPTWVGGLRYSDASYPFVDGMVPAPAANLAWNNSSTPDEYGQKITVPFACKVSGIWVNNRSASAIGDFDVVLYDDANNVLGSVTVDGDTSGVVASTVVPFVMMFNSEVTLRVGQVVRVTKKPTTATNVDMPSTTFADAAHNEATPLGLAGVATSRTDAGAWTDSSLALRSIGLIVSALDDGQNRGAGVRVLGSAVAGSVI